MKRRAAEVAAIKLCKASFESRPFSARSRDSRSSSTADKKPDSSPGDKPPSSRDDEKTRDRKVESSSSRDKPDSKKDAEKAPDKTDDVTMQPRSQQAAKCKSVGSDDSVHGNRRSSLRSSHPATQQDTRSAGRKADTGKKTKKNDVASAGHSESSSSSEADGDDDDGNTSSGTEISQPVKQRKLGIRCRFACV